MNFFQLFFFLFLFFFVNLNFRSIKIYNNNYLDFKKFLFQYTILKKYGDLEKPIVDFLQLYRDEAHRTTGIIINAWIIPRDITVMIAFTNI